MGMGHAAIMHDAHVGLTKLHINLIKTQHMYPQSSYSTTVRNYFYGALKIVIKQIPAESTASPVNML